MPTAQNISCYIPVLVPSTHTTGLQTRIVIQARDVDDGMLVLFGTRESHHFKDICVDALIWKAQQNGAKFLQGKIDLSANNQPVNLCDPARIQRDYVAAQGLSPSAALASADIPGLSGEAERFRKSGVFSRGVRHTL